MRIEILNVVEVVRRLGLRVIRNPLPRASTTLSGEEFNARLVELCEALEVLDGSGAIGLQIGDEKRSRMALRSVLEWAGDLGIDTKSLKDRLSTALKSNEDVGVEVKIRPRYASVDLTSIPDGDLDAIEAASARLESILGSIRGDLKGLREKAEAADNSIGNDRRFSTISITRGLEAGLDVVIGNAQKGRLEFAGVETVDVKGEDLADIRGIHDRIAQLGREAKNDPSLARIAAIWKRVVNGALLNPSLTTVTISFEDFKMINSLISELASISGSGIAPIEPQASPSHRP